MRAGDYERDESGLLLPRRRGIERTHPQWMGGPGFYGGGSTATAKINMLFDTGNGSTTFTDTGSGGSTWTGSGGGVVCSTTQILSGVSSLFIPSSTDYLVSSAYNSSNRIPATGDWDIGFMARLASASSVYVLSVQDSTPTAAGTAFAIATDSSSQMVVIMSDGTTRSTIIPGSGSTSVASNTNYTFLVTRRGSTIRLWRNSVNIGTGTFSGSVSTASGQAWRIGKPVFAAGAAPSSMYFDNFTLTY